MINMVQNAKDQAAALAMAAYQAAVADGTLPQAEVKTCLLYTSDAADEL